MSHHKNSGDKVVMVISKFDYKATDSHELDIKKGEKLRLIDDSQHWWQVSNAAGQCGYIPSNYVKKAKQGLFSSLRNTLGRSKKKSSSDKNKSNGPNTVESPAHGTSNSTENVMSRSQISISSGNNPLQRVQAIDDSDQLALTAQELAAAKPPPSVPPYHQMGDNFTFNSSDLTSNSFEHIMDARTNGADHISKDVSHAMLYCRAKFNYAASQSDELTVTKGDSIRVIEQSSDGWWKGQLENEGTPGPVGWFPSNYAEIIENSSDKQRLHNGALGNQFGGSQRDSKEALCRGRSASETSRGPQIGDDVLFRVVTLYPFNKNQEEELSFAANTTLHIIDQPIDDPDWWLARNSHCQTGLVPRNYLRKIDRSNSRTNSVSKLTGSASGLNSSNERLLSNHEPLNDSLPRVLNRSSFLPGNCHDFSDMPWYWGRITRSECEQMLLQYAQVGEFIVRDSEAHPGDFTITTLAGEKTRNFKVHLENSLYHIGQKVFDNIEDLIQHYRTHPIFKNEQERHYLTEPFQYRE